jgi:Ohr subfamily peroxiredoxin
MTELARPPLSLLDKYAGSDVLPLYTTTVSVTGGEARHGRASGIAKSNDGALDLNLRLPREIGGPGGGTNPEQLMAAGYAACFHGALNLIAYKRKISIKDSEVRVSVTLGRDPGDGLFLLVADVEISLPGLDRREAEDLIRETETVCPYAKVMRQGGRHSVYLL